jgi:membrane protease YdiL (CAAX protease family)
LIGLLLAFGLPALPLGSWLAPGDGLGPRLAREGLWWGIGALVIAWVLLCERLPLSSMGLRRPTWKSIAWAVAAAILMMASVMLSYAIVFPALGLHMNMAAVASITHVPLWLQTATMARAGMVEEILFRGYAIERIEALTGSKWLAGAISGLIFVAVHLSGWGAAQLIVVAFGAAILTCLYLYRRDLASNMLAHFLADFVGFMLARLQGA